jgi:hypothetical protein
MSWPRPWWSGEVDEEDEAFVPLLLRREDVEREEAEVKLFCRSGDLSGVHGVGVLGGKLSGELFFGSEEKGRTWGSGTRERRGEALGFCQGLVRRRVK